MSPGYLVSRVQSTFPRRSVFAANERMQEKDSLGRGRQHLLQYRSSTLPLLMTNLWLCRSEKGPPAEAASHFPFPDCLAESESSRHANNSRAAAAAHRPPHRRRRKTYPKRFLPI